MILITFTLPFTPRYVDYVVVTVVVYGSLICLYVTVTLRYVVVVGYLPFTLRYVRFTFTLIAGYVPGYPLRFRYFTFAVRRWLVD